MLVYNMMPKVGVEPTRSLPPTVFETAAYTFPPLRPIQKQSIGEDHALVKWPWWCIYPVQSEDPVIHPAGHSVCPPAVGRRRPEPGFQRCPVVRALKRQQCS